MRWTTFHCWFPFLVLVAICGFEMAARGVTTTWVGGNGNWDASPTNWSPASEPYWNDDVVFNTPHTVTNGKAEEGILSITMSNGSSLIATNGIQMTVWGGPVRLTDIGTDLTVRGADSRVRLQSITLNNNSRVILEGGTILKNVQLGAFDINSGTSVTGQGNIYLGPTLAAASRVFINDGTLSASPVGAGLLGGLPSPGTLTVAVFNGDDQFVDLDGEFGNGAVNVFANQTLFINARLSDAFSGDMNLFQESTLETWDGWTMEDGTLDVASGFIDNVFPILDVPAGVAHISGGSFTHTGGTISNIDTDGTLQFDAVYNQTGGIVNNHGLVVFDVNATIANGATFNMSGNNASMTVNPGALVTVNQPNFKPDGNGSASNRITVRAGGRLDLNLGVGGDESLDGTVTLDGGRLEVTTASDTWQINAGNFHMNNTSGSAAIVIGDALFVGDDTGLNPLDANLSVGGTGESRIDTASVTFQSDADVNIAAGATLRTGVSVFNSANKGANARFTGAGTWRLAGTNTFNETTTINMVGGTVDLDNSGDPLILGGNDTFLNANLTINAATMLSYGKAGLGVIAELNIADTRALTINLDDPNREWTVNSSGIIRYNGNAGAVDTFLAGSDLNMNGRLNVTGDGQSTARMNIGGTTNILSGGRQFRLAGGSLADPNRLVGGTVTGPGILSANAASALNGFGTINSDLAFEGNATLLADDGTLTINGTLLDMGTIGTADVDGVLHITNAWNTNSADVVRLQGGRLEGGNITNGLAGGIDGFGRVTAQLQNNTRIDAIGGTLVVDNPATDYDGVGSGGLHVATLATLELRDNAFFSFTGSAGIDSGATLFANGFELRMASGSTLTMTNGTFRSTNSTNFFGNLNVASGTSTIVAPQIDINGTSAATLTGSLRIESPNTRLMNGATFSGGGRLINGFGTMRLQDGVTIPVLLVNQATLELGLIPNEAEQTTGLSYQQASSGRLEIDLGGTGLADSDRLTLTGQAQLDGALSIGRIAGFNPAEGNTFTILSAAGGISGAFMSVDRPTLDPGLIMNIVYTPTSVMLQIARGTTFACDLNGDGAADAGDAAILFGNWGGTGAGDCNADGIVDAGDAGILFAEWTGDTSHTSVPEPTGCALVTLMMTWLARRHIAASRLDRVARDRDLQDSLDSDRRAFD